MKIDFSKENESRSRAQNCIYITKICICTGWAEKISKVIELININMNKLRTKLDYDLYSLRNFDEINFADFLT